MNLLVFDIGGTSVKYSLWQNEQLGSIDSFMTPDTWDGLKQKLIEVKASFDATVKLDGVAFSTVGSVQQDTGIILGASALKYIHHFPIKAELEAAFGLPTAYENDGKCAALAESWQGAAQGVDLALFAVIGTGVGGAILKNGVVDHGHNLYAGEFGFAILNPETGGSFSGMASPVRMAERYCDRIGVPHGTHSGKDVFELAQKGDDNAAIEVETFYRYTATGLFNLQLSIDPELIVIGGALSANPPLITEIENRVNQLITTAGIKDFTAKIVPCKFRNDANLLGAVKNYLERN